MDLIVDHPSLNDHHLMIDSKHGTRPNQPHNCIGSDHFLHFYDRFFFLVSSHFSLFVDEAMGRSLVIAIVVGAFCDHKDVMMMTKTYNMIVKICV